MCTSTVLTDTNSAASQHCKDHVRPFTELATDLAAGKAANYNFITPNLCNDMHGAAGCAQNGTDAAIIKAGDDWLKANVPPMIQYALAHDGYVFIQCFGGCEQPGGSRHPGQ